MFHYLIKRLLLVIPTLLGIITLNFFIIQLSPGGPVEYMSNKLERANAANEATAGMKTSDYKASRGLDPTLIEELKIQYGFDKGIVERYILMLKHYITFDLGESYYRKISVWDLILEKMPVSISLGLFSTLLIYLVSIPLGIYKAQHNGSFIDSFSSLIIVVLNAIPAFLFGILLIVLFAGGNYFDIFPLRGLVSDDFESLGVLDKIKDYLWHITLPVVCLSIGGFASLTLLSKNSFLEEMQKNYVLTAYAKGASSQRVLYSHIFRNAMLLVISSFPVTFLSVFMSGSLLIEIIFSLDGLGLLGYESILSRDYPVVFGTLYVFTLFSLLITIINDFIYTLIDPKINFDAQ
ncbi:microcin C ABC transporter permease YejB [Helicobacter fennelliae]|uniref:Oligopeptide transport system permease protein OppB n=2 Tax=Helicobacter fennelliae TaxID=215 RepID=T1D1L2_9HELI|nr:microcin C ABC transporter permease YejB [Helicobacter fennelliae]GAD20105.1 oligopeptide transport system permease protein OppB [Helicobacter fennelliae MRY12-0050]SQB98752.1 Oligopeptide ABC transporter integral membrane subunit [Helicobacter fennelliae]STP08094.1 Oligopeptide ABC transporter integral membrane subunit [Helicobacter fennelliae]STQ83998.1 Oligopeptide ABC transporter integral membrane subunit [Helicobacter fennelliae]